MSDKQVSVRIDAKAGNDIAKPFQELKKGADEADKALKRPVGTVKDLAREVKSLDKGIGLVSRNFAGMAMSAGLLDDRLAKVAGGIGMLHQSAGLLKGVAMLGGGGAASFLAPLVAGVAALGAAAVIASPKLQDQLGNALYKMSDAAKEGAERLARMKDRLTELHMAQSMGRGTLAEEELAGVRTGIRRPFEEGVRGMQQQGANANQQIAAMRMFPDLAVNPMHEAMGNLTGKPGENAAELREWMGPAMNVAPALSRERMMANGALADASKRQAAIKGRAAEFAEQKQAMQFQGGAALRGAKIGGGEARTFGADEAEINRQLIAANEAVLKAKQNQLEVDHKLRQSQIEQLKGLYDAVAAQEKLAAAAVKQQQESMKGNAVSFGMMDPMERMQLVETARQLKAGGNNMTGADLQAAMGAGGGVLREQAESVARKRSEQDPLFKELMEESGQNKKLQDLRDQQAAIVSVKGEVKNQIEATIKLDADEMTKVIQKELIPGIEAAIKDMVRSMQMALENFANETKQRAQKQADDDKKGAKP